MKKSDKKFNVTVTIDGAKNTSVVPTRSGVANMVRELLGNVEAGSSVTLEIGAEAVPVEVKEPVTQ